MKKINKGKTIIIPDIHQNLGFADAILEKEKDFDNVVFLGDFFDTFDNINNATHFSIKNVCKWINDKLDDERFNFLLGNHDLAYLASYTPKIIPSKNTFYCCSGWTRSKATDFNKYIDPKFFKKLKLCCKVGEYYCVHAGFQYAQFKPYLSEEDNIQYLYDEWEKDKLSFHHKPFHWIWNVSSYRGGSDHYSSPIWVDWEEFVPVDNIRQIVGHTTKRTSELREKEKTNFCLDNLQKSYMVVKSKSLMFESLNESDYTYFLKI